MIDKGREEAWDAVHEALPARSIYTYYVTAFNAYYERAHSNEVSTRSRQPLA